MTPAAAAEGLRDGVGELSHRQLSFLERARVGHLATADAAGVPHVVPVCYAPASDCVCIPIDEKPKRTPPERLKRLRNIAENPNVAFVVDHYDDRDWSRLGWLMIRGRATILRSGELHAAGVEGLVRRYPQYRTMALADLPMISIRPERVTDWGCL